ncbi:MAG: hypothetical protein JEZ10_06300 [Verrucomicrobia bacterium]|nr:hypothetical protein [Verrucomicrobiota bacterium]
MQSKQKWYDLKSAKALRIYAEDNFKLKPSDKKVYRALQSLESQQDGLCKDVVATHRTIARAAKVHRDTVNASLHRLERMGLIRYTPGSQNYADHKASRIMRFSLNYLREKKRVEQPAHKLAEILNRRPIVYGEKNVQPTYTVCTTNRLYASKPNVQSNKSQRAALLAKGCSEGQVLIELDFKAAEPTIIAQKLGCDRDGYTIIAQAEGMSVEQVKTVFNPIIYTRSRSILKTAKNFGITAPESIEFLSKVDQLREQLRRPAGKPVRHTTTETGTVIEAAAGKKIFNGNLLSYYAQGTISDYINAAALEIIELERQRGWKLAIPCHDAVYVIAAPAQIEELEAIVLKHANPGMTLKATCTERITQGRPNQTVHKTSSP